MKIRDLFESGKRLASQGIEVSRVNKQDFLTAKSVLKPLLDKAGLTSGWTAGGAGSFDPEHPYGGGGRDDSGDIDIMIDPTELVKQFPPDVEAYNTASKKPVGPKAIASAMADPAKKAKIELSASKWALATYMTGNGLTTDPGTLTVEYNAGGKSFSIDLIVRPKAAWELHSHDFSRDPGMRGGQLFTDIYPTLIKLASASTFVDPKTGEEKGNLQYSPDKGVVDRDTNKVIAINKNDIAKILIGPEATARDISSFSGLKDALQRHPDKWAQTKQLFAQQQA
jgi:hypothetical protein